MRIPVATYRLQFHKDFGFAQANDIVDYLHELGISDVYASPIFKARVGSMHGYDVVDHGQIDPALGGEDAFEAFTAALNTRGLGLILDIVPNHMGIGETSNAWWMDVLENGPSSSYANYFDIDWQPVNPHLENKVLLAILEDQYGIVLEDGKLRLAYEEGAFFVYYYDTKLPIAPRTYGAVLERRLNSLIENLGKDNPTVLEFQSILTAISHLPPRTEMDPEKLEERRREKEVIKRRIATLYQLSAEVREAIDLSVTEFNGKVGEPQSFDLLDRLMDEQAYRLAFWRVAGEEINYRRFFDINELAAIRTETAEVFHTTHQLILRFLAEGKATGLRVDHPDGLWDPAAYFQQLQQSYISLGTQSSQDELSNATTAQNAKTTTRRPLYIVAEKILAKGESLPEDWAVAGTTGYDFLAQVNGIFVRRASHRAFDKIYGDFVGFKSNYSDLVNSRKKMIMLVSLASEINSLSHQLDRISERNRHYRDFTLNSLTFAIREVIACLSVYRTYANASKGSVSETDQKYIDAAVEEAKRRNPRTARSLFDFIKDTLQLKNLPRFHEQERQHIIDFVMHLQQVTGPVMAKAVEDTSFYIYNRLVSLNEVGGEPQHFGLSLEDFHRQNISRRRHWPHSMLASSTHDTKRSEDVRARINLLSEIPADWRAVVTRWSRMNAAAKTEIGGQPAPDANDEYLFYQSLLGIWPSDSLNAEELENIRERITAYMQKAIKEAKVHTSWVNPNEAYDQALENFVRQVLVTGADDGFLSDFAKFQKLIAYGGMLNSLSQTLLKTAAPGVPDFYQGTELWDLSLVDPDNRRPVDYGKRRDWLAEIKRRESEDRSALLRDLLAHWQDGKSKLYLVYKALNFRRAHHALFRDGDYVSLTVSGALKEHICAFARTHENTAVLVIVPRLTQALVDPEGPALRAEIWRDTSLMLPRGFAPRWHHLFTGEEIETAHDGRTGTLPLSTVLADFPVALLSSGVTTS
ncbi:MAG: malto-oligosyltrehalose synthase [Deltaproteobacteria bacterium]|nr:malto-oligosyltrehalose synthase [Deltaproteobacteria bacterium]